MCVGNLFCVLMNACVSAASSKAGGIRFAEADAASAAHSHVHFDEKLHDSVVMVIPESDRNFLVKVSFGSVVTLYIHTCIQTHSCTHTIVESWTKDSATALADLIDIHN